MEVFYHNYKSFTEPAAEFTHRLSDISGQEGDDIEMYVELSRPDVPVNWMKNRMPLKPSERIHILCERYRQVLQILDAIPEDEGEYTVCLPDKTESSAIVKITGLCYIYRKPKDMTNTIHYTVTNHNYLSLPLLWILLFALKSHEYNCFSDDIVFLYSTF